MLRRTGRPGTVPSSFPPFWRTIEDDIDKEWDRDKDVQGLHILSYFLTTGDQDRESEDDYFKKLWSVRGEERRRPAEPWFYEGIF